MMENCEGEERVEDSVAMGFFWREYLMLIVVGVVILCIDLLF